MLEKFQPPASSLLPRDLRGIPFIKVGAVAWKPLPLLPFIKVGAVGWKPLPLLPFIKVGQLGGASRFTKVVLHKIIHCIQQVIIPAVLPRLVGPSLDAVAKDFVSFAVCEH